MSNRLSSPHTGTERRRHAQGCIPTGHGNYQDHARQDHQVFDHPDGYDFNLIGIRNSSSRANKFDDWFTVLRYDNKDEELDTVVTHEDRVLDAVNVHRAHRVRASTKVEKWSAGCQVMQDPDCFDLFMTLCERGQEKFGNSFTNTLLESESFDS